MTDVQPAKACTWRGCEKPAVHPQVDKYGRHWAMLCPAHHQELNTAVSDLDPRRMLRCWVLAKGGSQEAARRVF